MNDFEKKFREHKGNIVHKLQHYFEIYDRHFSSYRNKKIVLLEIGVSKGGSLELWREYFGEECEIIGIDINPACKQFETKNTKIFIGSQADKSFLKQLKKEIPKVDILIDDGSHMMEHLKISFEELYDWVDENGIYLVEDLLTSYWYEYEGGYNRKHTFIEYCKKLIDQLHAWHSQQQKFRVDKFTRSTFSMHFYNNIVVFEKRVVTEPVDLYGGLKDAKDVVHDRPRIENWWRRQKNKLYKHTGIEIPL